MEKDKLTNTEGLIVKSVLDYINNHKEEMKLPCEVDLEDIAQNTNVDKQDIIAPLWNISEYFDKHKQEIEISNSITVNIEMTGTPGLYSRAKDGTVIYQAIYKVEYYKEVI